MNTARDDQWADQDSTAESESEAGNSGSRRLLLGGAAGGFALAASGLLLPDWLVEEAEADKHPARRVQGRTERRQDRKRKVRRNRKDRQDHKEDNGEPAPGNTGQKDVEIVLITGPQESVIAEVWEYHNPWVLKWKSRTVGPNQQAKFTGSETKLVLVGRYLSKPGNLYFRAINRDLFFTPTIKIAQGSWDKNGPKDQGDVYVDQSISEGEFVAIDGFRVDRGTDSNQHKIFVIVALE
jgi:hypothetical protein